jgi:NAD(P) transhydrogenase
MLIERMRQLGGVCVATGTIPSKTMREAALHLTGLQQRAFYGSTYRYKEVITAADLRHRMQIVIEREWEIVNDMLRRNHIEIAQGHARFEDPHTVVFSANDTTHRVQGDYIVIAVGTRPYVPPSIPHDGKTILNADSILDITEMPSSMICIGAGVIGLEYASIFAALGLEITVVDAASELLPFVDREIVESLVYQLRQQGVVFHLGEKVKSVSVVERQGKKFAHTHLVSGKVIGTDVALYSAGRQSNGDSIEAEKAGLKIDKRGRLAVNSHYQTLVEHIYACGDVIGFPALASTSMEQGRLAALHAFDQVDREAVPEIYPYGIYTIPEISTVGATEEMLAEHSIPYEIGVARYREIARGQIMGDDTGVLKILAHRKNRCLLGVHAIGTGATELIHIGQAVIAHNGTIDYLINAVFNYPTLAECYKTAALDAHNRIAAVED